MPDNTSTAICMYNICIHNFVYVFLPCTPFFQILTLLNERKCTR